MEVIEVEDGGTDAAATDEFTERQKALLKELLGKFFQGWYHPGIPSGKIIATSSRRLEIPPNWWWKGSGNLPLKVASQIQVLVQGSERVDDEVSPFSFCWNIIAGWWFQIFFIFTPIWERIPIWLISFKGVETTN